MADKKEPRSEEQKQADHEYVEGQEAAKEPQPEKTIHDMTRVEEKSPEFWAGIKGEEQPEHESKSEEKAESKEAA